ncbi:MAG: bifunctional ADP-dependent NAD(P)H-hydrate dehydratase/NAD(P)H-hydrate epimerase [Leptospirales bacterium]|nr:bifunctional ADP-dependent NAD(P)H-hydrate dehydratase/NAD(P)H-hydrate epimerase [Leptospirales bacterium]
MNGNEQPLFDYQSALQLDRASQQEGLNEQQLMGQAALSCFLALQSELESCRRLLLLCGGGNNGGDGYALLYHLLSWRQLGGKAPEKILLLAHGIPRSDASRYYQALAMRLVERQTSVAVLPIAVEQLNAIEWQETDLIVEALLGAGQRPPLRPDLSAILLSVQRARQRTVQRPRLISIDVPAGLFEEQPSSFGAAPADAPLPDRVLCTGAWKLAALLHPQLRSSCSLELAALGFSAGLKPSAWWSSHNLPAHNFFRRSDLDHKYRAGHAWLIGGSSGMEGAAVLAARSFFAAGGGILNGWLPAEGSVALAMSSEPSVLWQELNQAGGRKPAALAIGPGLQSEMLKTQRMLLLQLAVAATASEAWLILDASATALALDGDFPEQLRRRTLLTPHGGEWQGLGGAPVDCVNALLRAQSWHRDRLRCWCLLKGPQSILFSPDGDIHLVGGPQGDLATAGSGDALAGILLAALCKTSSSSALQSMLASLSLLSAAARHAGPNPSASEFPAAIKSILSEDRAHEVLLPQSKRPEQ